MHTNQVIYFGTHLFIFVSIYLFNLPISSSTLAWLEKSAGCCPPPTSPTWKRHSTPTRRASTRSTSIYLSLLIYIYQQNWFHFSISINHKDSIYVYMYLPIYFSISITLTLALDKIMMQVIFQSLPNTRLESKTDSMAYNRAVTHLTAFRYLGCLIIIARSTFL